MEKERGEGVILRDHNGELIFTFYKEFGDVDVLIAESLSLMHGLLLCQDRDCNHLLMEMDYEVLVHMVCSGALAKWPLCNVLRWIRGLSQELAASVVYVYREANATTDKLAALQLNEDVFYNSPHQLPF